MARSEDTADQGGTARGEGSRGEGSRDRGSRDSSRDGAQRGGAARGGASHDGSARLTPRQTRNAYAEDRQARHGTRPESRRVMLLGIACALIVTTCMLLPVNMFRGATSDLTFAVFIDQVAMAVQGLVDLLAGNGSSFEQRFMSVLVCAVSGGALGLCGSTYQGAFNNPLAAPKTLGVMGGGALGALVYVLWLQQYTPSMPFSGSVTADQIAAWNATLNPLEWFWLYYGRCLCSIAGCFAIVGVVVGLTNLLGHGRISNIVVVMFGQVFSLGVTAVIQFARFYFTSNGDSDLATQLAQIENYTMINNYYFRDLLIVVLPIVLCMAALLLMRKRLTLLSFGDEMAQTMGVNVNRLRLGTIALCTLLTALAISFCGHVAFLGFISAHLARRIVGPDFRFLLPASMFTGAGLISLIQWICQSGLPYTSPYAAGSVCSIIGAGLFMVMVVRQRGEQSHGWN